MAESKFLNILLSAMKHVGILALAVPCGFFKRRRVNDRPPCARTDFLSAMWESSATPTVDSCSPRSGGKMQKLTLLESVSSRSSGPSKFVNQFSARHHVFSDSPSFFSRLEFTVLDARLHGYVLGRVFSPLCGSLAPPRQWIHVVPGQVGKCKN